MSDIYEMQERALEIAAMYRAENEARGLPDWGPSEYMAGYVGDVGALSKLVMANEGLREIPDYEKKLDHELGDNIWSVLVLCKKLGRDPVKVFNATMDELEARFTKDTPQ